MITYDTPLGPERVKPEITLDVFLGKLWAWRWVYVAAGLAGAALGFAAAALRPIVHQATATVIVRQGGQVPATVATSSMRAVIANHAVAAKVVRDLQLPQSAARFLSAHLKVEEIPGTYLIRVSALQPDAEVAARAANAVVHEAIALNASFNKRGADVLQGALQEELATARKRMNEAEQRLADFRRSVRAGTATTGLHESEITSARLHAEYDLATRLYEEIAVQFGKLRLQVAEQSAELLVVEEAFTPETPVSPQRTAAAITGALSALMAAVLVVALLALVSSLRVQRDAA